MTLTGRTTLTALVGALVVLAFPTVSTLLIVNAMIGAGITLDLVLAASLSRLQITRHGPARTHLTQTESVTVTVVNRGSRRLRALVRDGWPPSAQAEPGRTRIVLAPGQRGTFTTSVTPARRGDLTGGLVTVRSLGPLGIAARQRSLPAPWMIRVLPAFPSRRYLPQKLAVLRDLDGRHVSLRRGQGSEFDSLRSYVLGDDVRSIDWRSTARHGDVLVRTWRPERDRRIMLVLDTGRTSAGRVAGYPRLDASMDAALLLAALASSAGDRVDLIAADREVRARVLGVSREELLPTLTNEMARLEPTLIESDVALTIATVLTAARRRCLVIFLTDLDAAALEQGLLPRIGQIAARHQLIVAAVSDPRISEMSRGRNDATAVYQAAAAAHALARRSRAAALLRGNGAEVVDAPPGQLASALADRYLSLKAAGQL